MSSRRAPVKRKPLRIPPEPGVDTGNSQHLWIGGPSGYCADFDWKEWRTLVRNLRRAIRRCRFALPLPKCRGADHVEAWLEEVNFLIGQRENFEDRKTYELLDLEQGNDLYCILLCRKGYRIPKSALWSEDAQREHSE